MKVNWEGEDWIGLRNTIKASNLSDRDEILKVLDISDINKRKAQLKALNGGRTYRMLLDDYYPALRRIDYTLAYIARPFDVNEAKQVIKTKPQYLSLNEMFVVANTYLRKTARNSKRYSILPYASIRPIRLHSRILPLLRSNAELLKPASNVCKRSTHRKPGRTVP